MIQVIETLTQRVWQFADNVLPTNPFMFNGPAWPVGDYVIKNMSGGNVSVVLFGQTTVVPAHTNYEFMAHRQLESVAPISTKPVGKPRSVNAGEVAVGADGTAATAAPGTSATPKGAPDRGLHSEPDTGLARTPSPTGQSGLGAADRAKPEAASRAGPPNASARRRQGGDNK